MQDMLWVNAEVIFHFIKLYQSQSEPYNRECTADEIAFLRTQCANKKDCRQQIDVLLT